MVIGLQRGEFVALRSLQVEGEITPREQIQHQDQTCLLRLEIDALILKSFTFRTNYSQTRFSDQDNLINSYKFWDASLSYRKDKDSKWEFEAKATNLLDTKSQSNSSTSNISISASEYFIQPRFITFRFIYSL